MRTLAKECPGGHCGVAVGKNTDQEVAVPPLREARSTRCQTLPYLVKTVALSECQFPHLPMGRKCLRKAHLYKNVI